MGNILSMLLGLKQPIIVLSHLIVKKNLRLFTRSQTTSNNTDQRKMNMITYNWKNVQPMLRIEKMTLNWKSVHHICTPLNQNLINK